MLRVETVQFSKVASKPWDLFDYLGSASTMHSARKGKHRQHPYGGGDGDRSARSCNLSSNLLEVGFQRFWLSDLVSIFQLYIGNFISTRSSVVRFCLRVAKKCIWDEVTTWHHRFFNDFTCFYMFLQPQFPSERNSLFGPGPILLSYSIFIVCFSTQTRPDLQWISTGWPSDVEQCWTWLTDLFI